MPCNEVKTIFKELFSLITFGQRIKDLTPQDLGTNNYMIDD